MGDVHKHLRLVESCGKELANEHTPITARKMLVKRWVADS
jgi:hypothetical protein